MTCAAILTRAFALANVQGTSILSTTEQYDSLNAVYREVYEKCLNADDDYFITDWTFTLASMTAITNDIYTYKIALPTGSTGFYRLRSLEYQVGTEWYPMRKFAIQSATKLAGAPTYRITGQYLYIMFPASGTYSNFRAWHYPVATVYTSSGSTTDIAYPPQLEVDVLALQIAIDICRKQSRDYTQMKERRDEMMARFERAINRRDDYESQQVANVFASPAPWR